MQVALTKGLKAQGNVEDWLCKVEEAMFSSLRRLSKAAIADYQTKSREEWVVAGHPSQVYAHTKHIHTLINVHLQIWDLGLGTADLDPYCNLNHYKCLILNLNPYLNYLI